MAKPINFFRNLFPAAGGGSPFTLKRAKYNAESNISDVEEFTAESTRSGVPVPAPPNTDGTYSYSTSENYGLNPNGVVDYPIENRVKRAITATDIRTTNNSPGTPPSGFTTTSRLEFDYNYQIIERASYTDYTPILSGQNGLEVVRRDVKAEEIVLSGSVVGSSIGGYEYSSLPTIQIRVLPGQPSNLTEGGSQTFIQLYSDRVLTANLTINITISGTASSSDYAVSNNLLGTGNNRTLVMNSGTSSRTFGLIALQDTITEPTETVIFTITSSSNYTIGSNSSTTVNILLNNTGVLAFKFNPNNSIGLAGTITNQPFTVTNRGGAMRFRVYRSSPTFAASKDIVFKFTSNIFYDGQIRNPIALSYGIGSTLDNNIDPNFVSWTRCGLNALSDGFYQEFTFNMVSITTAITGTLTFEFYTDPNTAPSDPINRFSNTVGDPSPNYQGSTDYGLNVQNVTITFNVPAA